jgi:hypothetical protein
MTDLSTIKQTERTIDIVHPANGENIGLRITLVSLDDERMTKIRRSITDRRLHLEARGKALKADEVEENADNVIFTATIDWEWYNPTGKEGDKGYRADAMPDFKGEQPEFTRRNFFALIGEISWIKNQINEALGDTRAFFAN